MGRCYKICDEELCVTPVECVFDAFSPCKEEPRLPLLKPKKTIATEVFLMEFEPIRRQLNFDLCSNDVKQETEMEIDGDGDCILVEEERFVEAIYKSVVDSILSAPKLQKEEANEPKTPTDLDLLSGVPDCCPGAPVRVCPKSRNFPSDICRKLEF